MESLFEKLESLYELPSWNWQAFYELMNKQFNWLFANVKSFINALVQRVSMIVPCCTTSHGLPAGNITGSNWRQRHHLLLPDCSVVLLTLLLGGEGLHVPPNIASGTTSSITTTIEKYSFRTFLWRVYLLRSYSKEDINMGRCRSSKGQFRKGIYTCQVQGDKLNSIPCHLNHSFLSPSRGCLSTT